MCRCRSSARRDLKIGLPLRVVSSDGQDAGGDDDRFHFVRALTRRPSRFWSRAPCGIRTGASARRNSCARGSCGRPSRGWSSRSPPSRASTVSTLCSWPTGPDGKLVAHQRLIRVGPIVGDNYPVLEGIKAGEKVVVSGSQKLQEGAPIAPAPEAPAPGAPVAQPRSPARQCCLPNSAIRMTAHDCRYLHPPSDPRERLLAGDHPRRRHRHPDAADRAVPGARAADGHRQRVLPGRERRNRRDGGHAADRTGDQRRRGHAVHDVVERQQRIVDRDGHVQRRSRHRRRGRGRAEPRLAGRRAGCRTK